MKAKYVRPMHRRNPEFDREAEIAALRARRPYRVPRSVEMPAGHVVDHPDAWKLVRMGVAIPADEECAEAAGMTREQMFEAARRYEALSKGIQPEKRKQFFREQEEAEASGENSGTEADDYTETVDEVSEDA